MSNPHLKALVKARRKNQISLREYREQRGRLLDSICGEARPTVHPHSGSFSPMRRFRSRRSQRKRGSRNKNYGWIIVVIAILTGAGVAYSIYVDATFFSGQQRVGPL